MGESLLKEDPLSRIQREIIEVTEREREFKEGHFRINRLHSESALEVSSRDMTAAPRTLARAVSATQLPTPAAAAHAVHTNGYTRRFTPQGGTKGLMQRFIANKGKLPSAPALGPVSPVSLAAPLTFAAVVPPPLTAPVVLSRTPEGKPVRKGYVPVEEKIQKELREMKNREHELRRMRRKQRPYELDLSDEETASESEDEDIPPPGKLKAAKSIGELYEELRSPSPRSGPDSLGGSGGGGMKPAKSLAELCELAPGQEFLAPSSTRLIAQWESIIQQKQEAGAA